jgi:branched-chain amino acid transport system ATP-binding protein
MLRIDRLAVSYGGTPVLTDVSLDIGKGSLALVIGPNGHGKSTMLKALCGLIPKAGGTVTFDGRDITRARAADIFEQGIVYVSELRNLFNEMTVRENIRLGAQSTAAQPHLAERLDMVLELFPRLGERLDVMAGSLSGGEARMLAIARAIMSGPALLALDEPTLGMAPVMRAEVFAKITEINRSGMTILLVEQDFTNSARLTDNIHILENGQIVFKGSRDAILANDAVRNAYLGL